MDGATATELCAIETALHDGPVEVVKLDWPADCGAEAVFVGRTRCETHPQYGPLQRLEYEVYPPMARKVLSRMATDAATRWPCRVIHIVHAQGVVKPEQASVVIQVATGHRGDAFAACRYLIDRLKHELPIWKRQVWQHGETFVEGCCAHRDENAEADDAVEGPE